MRIMKDKKAYTNRASFFVQNNLEPMQTQHNAVFYGIEDDDDETLTARFIGQLTNDMNDYSLWGAGEADQDGIKKIHDVTKFYDDSKNFYFFLWTRFPYKISLFKTYRAYKRGKNFLNNINPYWKSIIGAEDLEVEQVGCRCCTINLEEELPVECENIYGYYDCESLNCDNAYPIYETTATHKASDGFILVESAMNAPGMNYKPQEMPGSGHFQMRNDENTKEAVRKIFKEGLTRHFFSYR